MKQLALIALMLAPPAFAAPLPALNDVTGVAGGDTLNVREAPSASAAVVGTLAPDARGIEAVAERDGWVQVNAGERSGWVNARYLRRAEGDWQKAALPKTLRCFGTEPFWSLSQAGGDLVLSTPGAEDQRFALRQVLDGGGPQSPQRSALAEELTAVITPATCSDGMSDRAYGLAATVLLGAAPNAQQLSGCCSLAP